MVSGDHWTAFVPAAARWPVEIRVVPHRHRPDLAALADAERDELAAVLPELLRRFDAFYPKVAAIPYIAAWHQAPVGDGRDLCRLHLDVFSIMRAPRQAEVPRRVGVGDESVGERHHSRADRRPSAGARKWGLTTTSAWHESVRVDVAADRLGAAFGELAGGVPDGTWAAPGRVNVIGEHVDYNAGRCLPMALPHRTYCAVRRRTDGVLDVRSGQGYPSWSGPVDTLERDSVVAWARYVAGAVWALRRAGADVPGLDVVIDSDVPIGAGLSSSAALICATARAAAELSGWNGRRPRSPRCASTPRPVSSARRLAAWTRQWRYAPKPATPCSSIVETAPPSRFPSISPPRGSPCS